MWVRIRSLIAASLWCVRVCVKSAEWLSLSVSCYMCVCVYVYVCQCPTISKLKPTQRA